MQDTTGSRRAGPARGVLLALLLCAAATGCAVMREEHRNVLEFLDDNLAPEPVAARVALAPLAVPIGLIGYVTDSFLVNPVRVADDAWFDAVELLWESQAEETTFRRVLIAPFAALATPLVWAGDWVARILFPVGSRPDPGVEPEPPEAGRAPDPGEPAPEHDAGAPEHDAGAPGADTHADAEDAP